MTSDPRALGIAAVAIVAIVAVGAVYFELSEHPARDAVANVKRPSVEPGPRVPQPEEAPPRGETITGDGTVVVGKQVKAGSYRTAGGPDCTWARLVDFKGQPSSVRDQGPAPTWTQVALVEDVVGFETHGCPEWVMVR